MRLANRRRFICMALGTGGSLALGTVAWLHHPGGNNASNEDPSWGSAPDGLPSVTQTSRALGAEVSMTALHPSREVARRAIAAAMAELELVGELMSLYRPQSQLCRLNRDAVLHDPHPYLATVLRRAEATSRRTGGAFDVTVQPLWLLLANARKTGRLPQAAEIEAARRKVDWRRVEIAPRRIQLHGHGTAVTLNGIAQGFAADRAMAALRRHGVRHALVNTGEIGTLGGKTQTGAWKVGIQHPRRENAYVSLATLRGRCLATSGDYATALDGSYRDHHLFDPRSGRSPNAFSSVSVAAATAMQADALSTAVFVLGLEKGIQLIRSTAGADVLLVRKDGSTLATEGLPAAV